MSEFKTVRIDRVDHVHLLDDQSKTIGMMQGEYTTDDEKEESLMITTVGKSSVGQPVSPCEEVVKQIVRDHTQTNEDDEFGIKYKQTTLSQRQKLGEPALYFGDLSQAVGEESKVLETTFEGGKERVVNEHPDQIEEVVDHSVRKQTKNPVISIGSTNNRHTGQLIKKVSPDVPRPNGLQETSPGSLSSLSFEDVHEVNWPPPVEATPENNTSKTDSNELLHSAYTTHELLQRTYKRKNYEDESDSEMRSGKKARSKNSANDFLKSCCNVRRRLFSEELVYLKYMYYNNTRSSCVGNCMQNCSSEVQDCSVNKATTKVHNESWSLADCIQSGKGDNCAHQPKTRHNVNRKVNALGCEVEDLSPDECAEHDDFGREIKKVRKENLNVGNRKLEVEKTLEPKPTQDEEIPSVFCEERNCNKNRKELFQEFHHPEVDYRIRGRQSKLGKQQIKRTQRKKTQTIPICRKAVPPDIDKCSKTGHDSSILVNEKTSPLMSEYSPNPFHNDHLKRPISIVPHALDGFEPTSANMPNLSAINPDFFKNSENKEKPDHKETKLKLKKFLKRKKDKNRD